MARIITIEIVRDKLDEMGNGLLETDYIDAKTQMKYLCRKHNVVHYGTWSTIKQGKSCCPLCKKERKSKSQLLPYKHVKSIIEERGCKLVSKEYQGNKRKLVIRCNTHGEFLMTFDSFNSGQGCPTCGKEKQIRSQTHEYEFIKSEFEKRGYILLDTEYIDCDTPMRYICPCHPDRENRINYNNLRNGKGCRQCYEDSITGENSYLWQGGITQENKSIRNSKEYRNWRKKVFERDEYICQCCGQKGGTLNAHHIENFSDNEDKRFDLGNGITLCESCHSVNIEGSFHHTYGNYNNNREQLEEYIKSKQLCADIL